MESKLGNKNDPSSEETAIASLYEVEEVDMDSETMDPFEWTARKLVSVPKAYYWDTDVNPKELPVKLKVWHRSVGLMGSAVRLFDNMGKPVAGALGLSSSRFNYVTSTMTDRDWETSRRHVEERAQMQQQDEAECGNGRGYGTMEICDTGT
eukprot:scaffold9191_cov114-Cylindrotheca_fusiformis.AAC.9